nr:MAG TPA: hypothetical protein [Bacteriophage sp.]
MDSMSSILHICRFYLLRIRFYLARRSPKTL